MEIISARLVSEQERKQRREYFKNTYGDKHQMSKKWVTQNIDRIKTDHANYDDVMLAENYYKLEERRKLNLQRVYEKNKEIEKHNAEMERKIDEYKKGMSVICGCERNGLMRYIEEYNFLGCCDYKKEGCARETINYKYPYPEDEHLVETDYEQAYAEYEYKKTYLSSMKKYYKYPKYVKVSDIYRLLKLENIPLYNEEINDKTFSIGPQVSMQSRQEEEMLYGKMTHLLKGLKIMYQPEIAYKTNVDDIEHFARPDYIVYNTEKIIILEAKKDIWNCDVNKLEFYHNLVDCIPKKNSNVDIFSFHLIFDRSEANADMIIKNKVITINDLQDVFN
jgi:hypothetical protein